MLFDLSNFLVFYMLAIICNEHIPAEKKNLMVRTSSKERKLIINGVKLLYVTLL